MRRGGIGFLVILLVLTIWEVAGASGPEVLKQRAEQFRSLGLTDLAREQYLFLQKQFPGQIEVKQTLAELSQQDSRVHFSNALNARKHGALKLALYELERAMKVSPDDQKLKNMHLDISKELTLKQALNQRVSADYLLGLSHYEAQRYDRALENFVKVLNMAPDHLGAKRYVDRIGQKMGVSGK